jgi:hypothetical protein
MAHVAHGFGPARSPSPAWREKIWSPWWRFTIASGIGELVGLTITAIAALSTSALLGTPRSTGAVGVAILVMSLAGAAEGAALGYAQSRVLRRLVPTMSAGAWTLATSAGGVIAWIFGVSMIWFSPPTPYLPVFTSVLALVAMAGATLGAIMGAIQWLVLRRHLEAAGGWIVGNMFAWGAGLVVAMLGASIPSERTPIAVVLFVGSVTGLATGLLVGAISGGALLRVLYRPRESESTAYDRRWRS